MSEHRQYLGQLTKALETQGKLVGVLGDRPLVQVDARKQIAVLSSMSEEELRALAAGAGGELGGPAGELVTVTDEPR
jgi:hypothetical protein